MKVLLAEDDLNLGKLLSMLLKSRTSILLGCRMVKLLMIVFIVMATMS